MAFSSKITTSMGLVIRECNWVWSSLRHLLLNHLQLRLQTQAVQLKPNLRKTGLIYFCFKIYGMNSIFHELLHMQYITCKLVLSGVWRSTFTSVLGDEKEKHQNEPWCISLTSDSYPNLASERKAFVSSLCIIHTLKFCTVDRPRETHLLYSGRGHRELFQHNLSFSRLFFLGWWLWQLSFYKIWQHKTKQSPSGQNDQKLLNKAGNSSRWRVMKSRPQFIQILKCKDQIRAIV